MKERFIVSACLAGKVCAYDGRPRPCQVVIKLVRDGRAVPVCPECLGGQPVPRPPAEIRDGTGQDVLSGQARVVNILGHDVTESFVRGARAALKIAGEQGIRAAILKAKSPSCGYGRIYDGTFSGKLRSGHGVTTALLLKAGFRVLTENEAELVKP